jgi:predicted Zn-ribbon and HTH transcriptional regulator
MTDRYEEIREALAHEIWAAAQLAPGEGIVDGVDRIAALLRKEAHTAITHCDNCGCDWLDNGLNPVGCPYCKQSADAKILVAERDALEAENERLREVLAAMVSWFPSADTYLRLGFDPKTPMQVLKEAKAVLFKENRDGGR